MPRHSRSRDVLKIGKSPVIIIIIIVGLYLCFRVIQGFPYLFSYFNNVFDIIRFGNSVSFDVREDKAMGKNYFFIKQIRDLTPKGSTICFWSGDPVINPSFAAYFLYPRTVTVVPHEQSSSLNKVMAEGCNYLLVSNGLPDFDMAGVQIAVFGVGIDAQTVSVRTSRFVHNDGRYVGKTGIIKL